MTKIQKDEKYFRMKDDLFVALLINLKYIYYKFIYF